VRLSIRTSRIIAISLVLIGVFRLVTDTLHERDANYWMTFQDSWLRYFVRAPSDGTVLGWLNAQWFKLFSLPCGISLIYVREWFRRGSGVRAEFHHWSVRGVWIAMFFLGFTAIELQKQFHLFNFSTHLVEGENPWLNHLAHVLSAICAWTLSGWYSLPDDAREEPKDS